MTRSKLPPEASAPVSKGLEPRGAESASALAVAYAAYQRTAPSEREVSLGVARVRARLYSKRRRFRTGSLLAFAVVFVGALAYAAGALVGRPSSAVSEAAMPASAQPRGARPERTPEAATAGESEARAESEALGERVRTAASPTSTAWHELQVEPAPAPPASAGAARPSASGSRPAARAQERSSAATWAVVAESMAAKDHARAEQALRALANSDASDTRDDATRDDATRDNARLGLAQLALGRGDCAEARRLAQRVLEGAPSVHARRRSEEVLARCALR